MNYKPMFMCDGWREVNYATKNFENQFSHRTSFEAAFMPDGSVRELRGVGERQEWLALGTWQWLHHECCISVFIPGRTVELSLDKAITNYLSWLAKQVVN